MTPTSISDASETAAPKRERDLALDVFRASALFVVVAWHWVFTILRWGEHGPRVDNPISELPQLSHLTWVLQVMPLFFLVGGALTARSTAALTTTGERFAWVGRRARRLLVPALPLVALLGTLYAAALLADQPVAARAIYLTATPLWFLLAYFVVAALLPLWGGAAQRWPVGHVVVLAGGSVLWDVNRFTADLQGPVTWLSYIWVWLTVHQAGALLDRFADPRRALVLLGSSLGALVLATHFGPYPVPMVGTRTHEISNMGPPTAVLLALAGVLLALVALSRDRVERVARRHRAWVQRTASLAMPVYLWHMVGFTVVVLALYALGVDTPEEPTLGWWLARPFWVVAPALAAWPLVRLAAGPARSGARGGPPTTPPAPAPSPGASG